MSTGPVELQGITINAGILETLQGFSTQRNVLKGITIAVGTGASIMQLKVVDRNHEPIEGATCRVLNAIGWSNNVLSFDGVDDYVHFTMDSATRALITTDATFELMVKRDEQTPLNLNSCGAWTITTLNSSGKENHYPYTNGTGYINTLRSARLTIGLGVFDRTQWHRLSIVTTPGTNGYKLYQDGNLVYQGTGQASVAINTAILYLGWSSPRAYFWKGKMSDYRLWNVARTQEQIQADMHSRLNGDEAGLVQYMKLDEGSGINNSGLNTYGTIYGATWAKAYESFPLFDGSIHGYDPTPYDSQTTNANGLTTLNYQINTLHGLEVTLPGKRRFIMPFERTARGLLDWQVMLSDYLATFATDRGNILINSEPENNDANFLIE